MPHINPSGGDTVGTEGLARLLGISPAKIRDLRRRGVIQKPDGVRNFNLLDTVAAYTAHLREQAAGRNQGQELLDARLAKAKADANKATIQARTMAGDLIAADQIERRWNGAMRVVRSSLLATTSRIANRLNLNNEAKAVVADEIEQALSDLADDGANQIQE